MSTLEGIENEVLNVVKLGPGIKRSFDPIDYR